MNYTDKVRGYATTTKNAIVQNMTNVHEKMNSLPANAFGQRRQLRRQLFELLAEYRKLNNLRFSQLNDRPNIATLTEELRRAAKEARSTANELKDATKAVTEFATMVSNVTRIVALFAGV